MRSRPRAWFARTVSATAVSATALVVAGGMAPVSAQEPWLSDVVKTCPALFTLAVQGTGESSPDAPVNADTGMLGTVVSPLMDKAREAGVTVDRAYVPYPSGFGGMVAGGDESYAVSVQGALDNLTAAAAEVLDRCPTTKLGVLGYSQGGHAASMFLQEVGKGTSAIPASAIAAAALFGSPTRAEGSENFPGSTSSTPSAVPGTTGSAIKALPAVSFTPPPGAGIGPVADLAANYGDLTGRVMSWCQGGDLACDAPPNAPIARAVANVAGQAEIGGDPFVAVQTISLALANTAFRVGVDVINEDIQVPQNSLENLSIAPQKTISERVAEASDPRTPMPTADEALGALMKLGLVALNSVVSVATEVITPDTIAAVAAVGLSNPAAAFGLIAAKTIGAVMNLVPPATTQRVVQQTFELVSNEIEANEDLFDLQALASYASTQAAHHSYGSIPVTTAGTPPTDYVAAWFAAAAVDLASSDKGATSTSSTSSTASPTSTSSTSSTASPTSTTDAASN